MKLRYSNKPNPAFIPYDVTFTITTREEGEWFHDNIAIKITDRHEQIGEAYVRNNSNVAKRYDREFELSMGELKSDPVPGLALQHAILMLSNAEGTVTIHEGVCHFEDGTTIDLTKLT